LAINTLTKGGWRNANFMDKGGKNHRRLLARTRKRRDRSLTNDRLERDAKEGRFKERKKKKSLEFAREGNDRRQKPLSGGKGQMQEKKCPVNGKGGEEGRQVR